jgi:CRISPR/Cas system CSM-associated protein Csm3 (group 7 of RAMP superfamily)
MTEFLGRLIIKGHVIVQSGLHIGTGSAEWTSPVFTDTNLE